MPSGALDSLISENPMKRECYMTNNRCGGGGGNGDRANSMQKGKLNGRRCQDTESMRAGRGRQRGGCQNEGRGKAEKWNGGDRGGGGGKVICASKGKLDLSLCSSVSVRPLIYIALSSPAAALLV